MQWCGMPSAGLICQGEKDKQWKCHLRFLSAPVDHVGSVSGDINPNNTVSGMSQKGGRGKGKGETASLCSQLGSVRVNFLKERKSQWMTMIMMPKHLPVYSQGLSAVLQTHKGDHSVGGTKGKKLGKLMRVKRSAINPRNTGTSGKIVWMRIAMTQEINSEADHHAAVDVWGCKQCSASFQ